MDNEKQTMRETGKVFAYLKVQKKGLRFTVFTNARSIPGVDLIEYESGGQKWGRITVSSQSEIPKAIRAFKSSFNRLVDAIKRGDNTGWYAEKD